MPFLYLVFVLNHQMMGVEIIFIAERLVNSIDNVEFTDIWLFSSNYNYFGNASEKNESFQISTSPISHFKTNKQTKHITLHLCFLFSLSVVVVFWLFVILYLLYWCTNHYHDVWIKIHNLMRQRTISDFNDMISFDFLKYHFDFNARIHRNASSKKNAKATSK